MLWAYGLEAEGRKVCKSQDMANLRKLVRSCCDVPQIFVAVLNLERNLLSMLLDGLGLCGAGFCTKDSDV